MTAIPDQTLQRSATDVGVRSDQSRFPRLPFTRQEAESISSMLGEQDRVALLDFKANLRNAISSELSQFRIVHFATHGLLNTKHPDLSGLILSLVDEQGRDQDGFLSVREIYNLKLPIDLVVLSSCQTALGKDIRGEGLVGLTRGFMYAGVPRLVASLWKVEDVATAELMQRFYRGMLIERMSPAEALRVAQLGILKQPQWSAPYYWAGFILQGDWN